MESDGRGAPDGDANGPNEANSTERGGTRADLPRRGFLRLGGAALAATGLTGAMGSAGAAGGVADMADPSKEYESVGGGDNYGRRLQSADADYVVSDRGAFLDAIDAAGSGDLVMVEHDAQIDLTGLSNLSIADGVTLAGRRGYKGGRGGMLYTDDYPSALFKIYSDDVRISGLRIRGPRMDYFQVSNFGPYESQGVWILGENGEVDNCQFYGWPVAGVSIGAKNRAHGAHIHHCSLHNNAMEGYGYGAMLWNGHSLINNNYFNMNRHSITGFGYETNGYEARYNLVGPETVSHAFDMHGLNESTSTTSNVAGGFVHIHHNSFQFTHDILDRAQEAVTIRGVPAERVLMEKNRFKHDEKPDSNNVSENGQAYRQNNLDGDNWQNVYVDANHFGTHRACSDVGHFRPLAERPAWAYSPGRRDTRSALQIDYLNGFDDRLRITDVTIEPTSSKIKKLADHSWGEGRWKSEVHTKADVRSGTTDLGGGQSLPGSIALDADGHSDSPNVQPIVSGRSTAAIHLCDFLDRRGRPVDMLGERVKLKLDCVVGGDTDCHDEFVVEP